MKTTTTSYKLNFLLLITSIIANQIAFAGAGVLPYTIKPDGKYYILLGKEYRSNIGGGHGSGHCYSEFGGKEDKSDKGNKKMTAAREATEETRHVFGNGSHSKGISYLYPKLETPISPNPSWYPLYPAKVNYLSSKVFNNAKKVPHFEKSKYIWIESGDLLNSLQGDQKIPAKYDSSQPYLYNFFVTQMSSTKAINFLKKMDKHNKNQKAGAIVKKATPKKAIAKKAAPKKAVAGKKVVAKKKAAAPKKVAKFKKPIAAKKAAPKKVAAIKHLVIKKYCAPKKK